MFLKSAFRAVARRWQVGAAVAGAAFVLGLLLIPRLLTYRSSARLVLLTDRWTPGRAEAFAQSPAVLEEGVRILGSGDAADLASTLRVRSDGSALEISAEAGSRGRAIDRVNAVGRAFERESAAARKAENAAALKRIEATLAGRRQEQEPSEPPGSTIVERAERARRDTLERAVEEDRLGIAALSARIEVLGRIVERNDAGPARPVNTAESDRLSAELALARRDLEGLRATYPEDWPPVVKAAARVEELRTQRAIAANREILEARFAPFREALEELRNLVARREQATRDQASHEAELRPLRARLGPSAPPIPQPQSGAAREEELAALGRELEGARSRLALERASGDAVVEPFAPASAARLTGAALPWLAGLAILLGIVAAWSVESLAVTLRTEQDIRRYVNLPLLASVPHEKEASGRILPAAGAAVTESFNTLAALLETRAKSEQSRLFAVTSAVPSEGKSTVACNLSVALARAGSRVLLVDVDLRRGTQHHLFSVANEPGLSAYLQGGTDTIDSLMTATDVDNLTLMPAGAPMQNPIPFLHAERFHALLRDLRGWYEYVILDLPPVRSAADALIVSPLADAVLLVVSAGLTRKDDVTYTKRMIRSVNAKPCGCVLVNARVRSGGYYYYAAPVPAEAAE